MQNLNLFKSSDGNYSFWLLFLVIDCVHWFSACRPNLPFFKLNLIIADRGHEIRCSTKWADWFNYVSSKLLNNHISFDRSKRSNWDNWIWIKYQFVISRRPRQNVNSDVEEEQEQSNVQNKFWTSYFLAIVDVAIKNLTDRFSELGKCAN